MSDTVRFTYEEPPFADNFVEFSASWTRRETREFAELNGDAWLALIARKMTACKLDSITAPAQLTPDAIDDMDVRLFRWLTTAATAAYVQVNRLGEAAASRLSATFAAATQTETAD